MGKKVARSRSSGDVRCEMAPEEFAKFYPPLLGWRWAALTASTDAAETVASRGFWRLPLYFTEETLTSTKVVLVDPLPMPPLSSMGLAHFADFERGNFEGVTYIDTFFLKPIGPGTNTSTFMSLFTSFNGDCLDQMVFYFHMRMVWNASAIGKAHWKLWRTMLKRHSLVLQKFLTSKRWSQRNLVCNAETLLST